MPAPADLVHVATTSTGTGDLVCVEQPGKRTFAGAFGTGVTTDVFDYFISHRSEAEWERGTGHMSDATTLVRDTVLASSNSGALVNFSAGTKDIANDVPANLQVRGPGASIDSRLALWNGTSGTLLKDGGVGLPLPVASGGTGGTSAATARSNLGLVLGTNVQAYDAALASLAGLSLASGDLLYATGADTLARLAKGTDGQMLTLASGLPIWGQPFSIALRTFTTSGSYNHTTGMQYCIAIVTGSGGGGGSASSTAAGVSAGGAGGGAGSTAIGIFTPSQLSGNNYVTIGSAGGTASNGNTSGLGANATTWGLLEAPGGKAGGSQMAASTRGGYGASGGAATDAKTGTIKIYGAAGSPGIGAGGNSTTLQYNSAIGGTGGASFWGGGGQGGQATGSVSVSMAGGQAFAYGAGGGGGASANIPGGGGQGGQGGAGFAVIIEFIIT